MHQEPLHSPHDYTISFQRGEERGFAWFFRQLYPALSFFAQKIINDNAVAEDIASNAFVKIWERHSQFHSAEGIRSYLYQIVRNDALKALKKRNKELMLHKDLSYLWVAEQQKDHFQTLAAAETTRQLMAAMNLLPPQCGRIFKLIYLEGKTINETARELNLSVSTVRTQQKRGLEKLRQKMNMLLSAVMLLLCNQL